MMYTGKIVGAIYETEDYSVFKNLKGNRKRDRKRIDDLKASILKDGGQLQPIQVNKTYCILDGQARFEALKELGLPVQYYVKEGAGLAECIAMNNTGKRWPLNDFIDSFIDREDVSEEVKDDYKRLRDYIAKYKKAHLTNTLIAKICAKNWTGGSVTKQIKHGEFRFKRPFKEATDLLDYLSKFANIIKSCGRKELLFPVLVEFYFNKEKDNDIFEAQCKKYQNEIHGVGSTEEARGMFEYIYWYNRKRKKAA